MARHGTKASTRTQPRRAGHRDHRIRPRHRCRRQTRHLTKTAIVTVRSHWRPDGGEAVLIHFVGGNAIEVVALLSQRRGTMG